MAYNGTAVGLCKRYPTQAPGTYPGTPPRLWRGGHKIVTVQGGYGALFAVRIQILLSITCVAVQVWSEPRVYPRLQNWWRALAQCRGTKLIEAWKLSRCIETLLWADERVRVHEPLQICLEGRSKSKKHDKQLTHIVRVSIWWCVLSCCRVRGV